MFTIQVWRCGVWNDDTWWSTSEAAEEERSFMESHGFTVRITWEAS